VAEGEHLGSVHDAMTPRGYHKVIKRKSPSKKVLVRVVKSASFGRVTGHVARPSIARGAGTGSGGGEGAGSAGLGDGGNGGGNGGVEGVGIVSGEGGGGGGEGVRLRSPD
jgi:hypothetical protein